MKQLTIFALCLIAATAHSESLKTILDQNRVVNIPTSLSVMDTTQIIQGQTDICWGNSASGFGPAIQRLTTDKTRVVTNYFVAEVTEGNIALYVTRWNTGLHKIAERDFPRWLSGDLSCAE